MSEINRNLRRSVSINMVGRYSNIGIQLVVTALLARTLTPQDFGLMAVVSVIAVFLSFVSEMGLGPAIIQFEGLESRQLAGLFWMTVAVGTTAGLVLAFSGPLIASVYAKGVYVQIAHGLGLNVALSCWAIVPLALLRRRQRFSTIAGIEIGSAGLSGACAVYSALRGSGVEALVVKSTANALSMFVLCMVWARPPMISPSVRGMKHVMSYSAYQFMFNLVNYFTRNLDKLLIGKFLGSAQLGLYDMSYRLMLMPVANLTHVVTPAIQPVYAAHGNNSDIIFLSYQKLIRVLLIGGGLMGLVGITCSPEIITLAYGAKWVRAIPVFSILSVSIVVQVVLSSTGSVFQALGKTKELFKCGMFSTTTTVTAIGFGVYTADLLLLSWLLVLSFFVNALQGFHMLAREGFGRSVVELFRPAGWLILGIVILGGIAIAAQDYLYSLPGNAFVRLATKLLVVGTMYFGLIFVTGDAAFLRRALAVRTRRVAI
ncbi:lipopolysaccharide biosynthesis protein [Paraburkholderia sediminicola]|uniref:lipopolysaccharide biosynthesis protein n=1 Tax=Paraburkholderia sediminicola TaxID=458836 RepID=UPI0038BBEFA9